jgi:hypothetical protein
MSAGARSESRCWLGLVSVGHWANGGLVGSTSRRGEWRQVAAGRLVAWIHAGDWAGYSRVGEWKQLGLAERWMLGRGKQ